MRSLGGPVSGSMTEPARPRAAAESDRVADLFAAALDLPESRRDAFLEGACAGDAVLRAELESLFAAHDRSGGFLDVLDPGRTAALIDSTDETMEGRRVGPYRLLRELGRGGMGVVYLAERAEGGFEQRVAVKLVKRGMDSEAILRRFVAERQILAGLDHPNIARLLDGGLTEDGQPFFALEYIEGEPLLDTCNARRLCVEARLELFEQACRAVEYAHGRLVVHRDLKPSNLLVTAEGQVKLLDFGVAKLLEPGAAAESTALTEAGMRPMTPAYAAPEQMRGGPVTTVTDVYALGVVLYELLTGRLPGAAGAPGEAERREPERPSEALTRPVSGAGGTRELVTPGDVASARATTPERLRRRLQGDLDTIVLQALHSEPERRYRSVAALAEDLRRHRLGLPVAARSDTLAYRLGKFARRHRAGVAAAAVAMAALVAGLAMSLWQAGVAARERDAARREAEKARAVQEFLVGLFKGADPWQGGAEDVTAAELLERGVERIERELAAQPDVQVELLDTVADVHESLGRYDRGRELAERALALAQRIHGREHLLTVRAQERVASMVLAKGDAPGAERLLREALAVRQRLLPPGHPELAKSMGRLADALDTASQLEPAEALFRQALAIQRQRLGSQHLDTVDTLVSLAGLLQQKADWDGAAALFQEALAAYRATFGEDSPYVARVLSHLGSVRRLQGDDAGAARYHRQALELRLRLLGEDHPDVATSTNNLAGALNRLGEVHEAEGLYRRAVAIETRALGADNPSVALMVVNLANVLAEQGRFSEAMPLFEQSLAVQRRAIGEDHPRVALSVTMQARALIAQGRLDEALPLVEEALAVAREHYGEEHPQVAATLALLAWIRAESGALAEAVGLYQDALAVQRRTLEAGHRDTMETRVRLGEALVALQRGAEAEPLLRETLADAEKVLPAGHWRRAEIASVLGACLARLGQGEEARSLLRTGYEGLEATFGADHPATRRARRRWQGSDA